MITINTFLSFYIFLYLLVIFTDIFIDLLNARQIKGQVAGVSAPFL